MKISASVWSTLCLGFLGVKQAVAQPSCPDPGPAISATNVFFDFDNLASYAAFTGTPSGALVYDVEFQCAGIEFGEPGVSAGMTVTSGDSGSACLGQSGQCIIGLENDSSISGIANSDIWWSFVVPGSSTDGVTDYVKFYYGDQSVDDDDVLTVTVYDINDNVLESTTVSLPGAGYVEFSYAVACIHKIHISVDDDPVDNRGFAVDNLTYNIPTAPNGCGAGGDPHFTRWGKPERDSFHGECDLVLLKKDNIIDGVDLNVQIRTTIADSYSYIDAAAVQYGETSMEFQMDSFYLNGEKMNLNELDVVDLGNGSKVTKVRDAKGKQRFRVNIIGVIFFDVWSTKHYMGIKVEQSKHLDGSFGMLGDYRTGNMVSRHGDILDNFEAFAFDWQVNPMEDPQIFMNAREPQLPYERCRLPTVSADSRRRKLRGVNNHLYEKAVEACTVNQLPSNVQSCIDDVMFTGELELAFEDI